MNAIVVLCFGVSSMLSPNIRVKLVFYLCGLSCFGLLCSQMNSCIVESSQGGENLCKGQSVVRKLVVITASTWVPFPIWYALSPEGFNIIPSQAAMKIAVAFLNVFSKGVYIFYLSRVNADMKVREVAMSQFEVAAEIEEKSKKGKLWGEDFVDKSHTELTARLACILEEVLRDMGRAKDYTAMKEMLETHMIINTDDVMVLTREYCESISLPWGFAVACKTRIKANHHMVEDAWTFHIAENVRKADDGMTSPLPPQVANDPRKLKEHSRRMSTQGGTDDDFDGVSVAETNVTQRTTPLPVQPTLLDKDGLQAAVNSSHSAVLEEIRLMRRQQMEQYSRVNGLEQQVNKDMENIGERLEGAMTQVMSVIEKRLETVPSVRQDPGSMMKLDNQARNGNANGLSVVSPQGNFGNVQRHQ